MVDEPLLENYLTREAFDRHQVLIRKTSIYKEKIDCEAVRDAYPLLGLISEVGELADILKTRLRASEFLSDDDRTKFLSETGDVLWYLGCIFHDYNQAVNHTQCRILNSDDISQLNPVTDAVAAATVLLRILAGPDEYLDLQRVLTYVCPGKTLNDAIEVNIAKLEARFEQGSLHDKSKRG